MPPLFFRLPLKGNETPVRGPGRAEVLSGIGGQPHGLAGVHQHPIDVSVVTFLTVPDESHHLAIGRKSGLGFCTWETGESNYLHRGKV